MRGRFIEILMHDENVKFWNSIYLLFASYEECTIDTDTRHLL